MADEKISCSVELLDEIAQKYNDAIKVIEDIILQMNTINTVCGNSYKGLTTDVMANSISKIVEHLELLKLSYSNTGAYVTFVKEDMFNTEEEIAKWYQVLFEVVKTSVKAGGGIPIVN